MNAFEKAKTYFQNGLADLEAKQFASAEIHFEKSLDWIPDRISTLNNLAAVKIKLKKYNQAHVLTQKVLEQDPQHYQAWLNKSVIEEDHEDFVNALLSIEKVLLINPEFTEAWINKGNILSSMQRLNEAVECYEKARLINPQYAYLQGVIVHAKMKICDWNNLEISIADIEQGIKNNEKKSSVFPILSVSANMNIQQQCAKIWIDDYFPYVQTNLKINHASSKIRVAYFSSDFRNHAVSLLTAEMFELHDKSKFEIYGFSFGRKKKDAMTNRLENAFDYLIDCQDQTDIEIVELSRRLNITIAVDLTGHTQESRTGIFTNRAAPIQINYIGFPGTMGASYIDYIIADHQLIPIQYACFYSEKIIYLPCFQANDRTKKISNQVFTRNELCLPTNQFIFCCFNNAYKITPRIFESWMRILKAVDGSVLWLCVENQIAKDNLLNCAQKNGIEKNRIIFANQLPLAEYLARYKAADLFLDTLPFNGGTTASDALWADLPVLTCQGESYASRMAGSLLHAVGLSELVVNQLSEYERIAIELARSPTKCLEIKNKLISNKKHFPLFDTPLFVRSLEKAYVTINERLQKALPIENIEI